MASNKKSQQKVDYYAQLILDIGIAENVFNKLEGELKQIKDAILSNIDLKKFLTDPSIDKIEKVKVIFEIFGKDASNAIKAATVMIVIMDKIELLDQIYNRFVKLLDKLKLRVFAEVASTVKLDGKMINDIKRMVEKETGLDVRIGNTIDKKIIGGIVIKIGDRVIDLSIKNKIEGLKEELKSIKLRGEEFGANN